MTTFVSWLIGIVMAVVGLMGLYVASNAADGIFYGVGLAFFGFASFFILVLIHEGVGNKSHS